MNSKKILNIFVFLSFFCVLNAQDLDKFTTLLHIENGVSDVYDERFFLTKEKTPKAEFDALLQAYEQNSSIACVFPARLSVIAKEANISLDLSTCNDLQDFIKTTKNSSLRLGFASNYLDSAMSYFGHNYLLFYNKDMPLFSLTVSFTAQIPENTSPWGLLVKGIFGGFAGKYSMRPYFWLYEEYANVQGRNLLELKLDVDYKLLVLHLWELRNISSDYAFFAGNCARGIYWLLKLVKPDFTLNDDLFGLVFLPHELMNSAVNMSVKAQFKTPLLESVFNEYSRLSCNEKSQFKELLANTDKKHTLQNANNNQIRLLNNTYSFLFKRLNRAYADYEDVKKYSFLPNAFEQEEKVKKFNSKKLSLKYKNNFKENKDEFKMSFNGFLIDKKYPQKEEFSAMHLEILSFEIGSLAKSFKDIDLTLLDVVSFNKYLPFYSPPSWGTKLAYKDQKGLASMFVGKSFGGQNSLYSLNLMGDYNGDFWLGIYGFYKYQLDGIAFGTQIKQDLLDLKNTQLNGFIAYTLYDFEFQADLNFDALKKLGFEFGLGYRF